MVQSHLKLLSKIVKCYKRIYMMFYKSDKHICIWFNRTKKSERRHCGIRAQRERPREQN